MENNLVLNLAYDVLAILVPVLAALVVELIRRKLGIEKMNNIQKELQAKQELATLAVSFVQQVYDELDGPEKYDLAADWLVEQAQARGIKLSSQEIKGLIESSLRMFKDTFGEEWAKQVKTED